MRTERRSQATYALLEAKIVPIALAQFAAKGFPHLGGPKARRSLRSEPASRQLPVTIYGILAASPRQFLVVT